MALSYRIGKWPNHSRGKKHESVSLVCSMNCKSGLNCRFFVLSHELSEFAKTGMGMANASIPL